MINLTDYIKTNPSLNMLQDWNKAVEVMMQAMDEEDYEYVVMLLAKMNEQYLQQFGDIK